MDYFLGFFVIFFVSLFIIKLAWSDFNFKKAFVEMIGEILLLVGFFVLLVFLYYCYPHPYCL